MHKTKTPLPYEIIETHSESFFKLSSELGDVDSFRRILSIMRLKGKCKSIIRMISEVDIQGNEPCQSKKDNRRCNSCDSYIKQMVGPNNNLRLTNKTCAKLYFFSCEIDENGISADKHQDYFLGYCTIHQDTLCETMIKEEKTYSRAYVPECVLKIGEDDKDFLGYKYGNIKCEVSIAGEPFEIDKGNYFSQQNGVTNCCAHAAIKTALRGYDDTISCDSINSILINSKKEKGIEVEEALEISRMARGLTPNEMLLAIKKFSQGSSNIPLLDPFLVTAHDLPITSFVETIYRAIESKLPVILLLRIPDNVAVASSFAGHAVSLIGHTFNEHNWCAYGSGYFSAANRESYLSSYLWCDNYVVQDDNFGPAYHLPCSFLSDYYEYGVSIEKLGLNIASQKFLDSMQPNYPLAAIIIPPAELKNTTEKLYSIEQIGTKYFVQQLNLFSRDNALNLSQEQQELFDRYFYYIFKYKRTKPRVFITRTLLTSKKEYLASSINEVYSNHHLEGTPLTEVLDKDLLPDYFWLIEISVPELYWINNRKIGEIIIDTEMGEESHGIKLIRLPFFLALYPEGDSNYYPIKLDNQPLDKKPHHELLRKKQGIIRQFKG